MFITTVFIKTQEVNHVCYTVGMNIHRGRMTIRLLYTNITLTFYSGKEVQASVVWRTDRRKETKTDCNINPLLLLLTKKSSRRYPAKTITDADHADDIAILENTPNQAETLLNSLERAAAGIGLHVNAHKMEYMCYNQTGDISTLDGTPFKLVDKFIFLGGSVSLTKKDIDTGLTKALRAINRLSIIWNPDLTDKMKRSFFQAGVVSILLYGCTTWTLTKRLEKKLDGNYTRMVRAILNKTWRQHPTRHQL